MTGQASSILQRQQALPSRLNRRIPSGERFVMVLAAEFESAFSQ